MDPSTSRSPIRIYSLENYSFGAKDGPSISKTFFKTRLENLKQSFAVNGMGKAVEAVLIVHLHDHPHVLLIQHQDAFFLYDIHSNDLFMLCFVGLLELWDRVKVMSKESRGFLASGSRYPLTAVSLIFWQFGGGQTLRHLPYLFLKPCILNWNICSTRFALRTSAGRRNKSKYSQ